VISVVHRIGSPAGQPGHPVGPALTGRFDTAQLPVIAAEPVTVTVARRIEPGWEAEFLKWADELIAAVLRQPGCLGAAVLHPGGEGGEYHIVVRFADGLTLRRWERSDERNELMERADRFVAAVRLHRTVGVNEWFEAAAHAEPPRPRWKRILFDVAWVYPVSLAMAIFVSPLLGKLPVVERVLLGATIITVAMSVAVGPARRWNRRRRRL
jgi:hypothetical protein